MLYLYDPRTNILTETNYDFLVNLTGQSKSTLMSYKSTGRKVQSITAYLTDEKVTLKQRRTWYQKEQYHNETWKVVSGSDNAYLVSNYGRFKRVYTKHEKYVMPFLKKRLGYLQVKIKFNGIYERHLVSKIVAYHFIGIPKQGQGVFHKNGVKTDNYHANLGYIDKKELGKKTGHKARSKPVVLLDIKSKEVLDEYRSVREAGRKCHVSYQAVLDNCNHKTKNSCGLLFMFTDEYEKSQLV